MPFNGLSTYQIYNIIQAREQVFVKDQNCTYIDADGVDFAAMHLSAYHDEGNNENNLQLLAYCRIIPPVKYTGTPHDCITSQHYPRIGRVLVLSDYRGYGLARRLMLRAIAYCHTQFPNQPIHISAQTYLIEFYQSLGFICEGAVFEEEGVEHMAMILSPLED